MAKNLDFVYIYWDIYRIQTDHNRQTVLFKYFCHKNVL